MWFWLKTVITQKNAKRKLVRAEIELDMGLVFLIVGLIAFGWLMVTSASMVDALHDYNNPYFYSVRQGIFAFLGLCLIALAILVPTDNYQKLDKTWLIIAFILLLMVLVPGVGRVVNGARRWIPMGIVNLQVAEVAKLCAIMYFANYLVKFSSQIQTFVVGIMRPLVILGAMGVLLLMQPDFGSTVVVFTCVLSMMFMAGVRARWYVLLIAGVAVMAILLVFISPYRMARVTGFLDPWANANSSGYQLVQALISYGRGGWFGDGLGMSIQKQFFLPEAHTDFITSIIAEELGAVGIIVLICVYGLLIFKGLNIARYAQSLDRYYQSYVAYGISFWVAFQVFVNVGVNIGVLPTKGLTLPLISYGGSSLLIMCFALGILLRIDFENKVVADAIKPHYRYVVDRS